MTVFARTNALFFDKRSSTVKFLLGSLIATPIVATLQGCMFLNEYRQNHRNAPRPLSPSRGIVMMSPENHEALPRKNPQLRWWSWKKWWRMVGKKDHEQSSFLDPDQKSLPPIRLLVIGDSLAAGVGSASGTSPLAETIAKAISKNLGGRIVYWICHGTPGASARQILEEIKTLQQDETNRIRHSKGQTFLSQVQDNIHRRFRNLFQVWNLKKNINEKKEENHSLSPYSINFAREVENESRLQNNEELEKIMWQKWQTKLDLQTENVNEDNFEYYDVAVILTGINDLKAMALPSIMIQSSQGIRGHLQDFKRELIDLMVYLRAKMKNTIHQPSKNTPHGGNQESTKEKHYPLIVIPAYPVASVPLMKYPPFNWLASTLLREWIEVKKQELAKKYPDSILFVDAPSFEALSQIEKESMHRNDDDVKTPKEGADSNESSNTGILIFKDRTRAARMKIEQLMKDYRNDMQRKLSNFSIGDLEAEKNFNEAFYHHDQLEIPSSNLISYDKIHPNTVGYEFWGRHIASAIIKKWDTNQG